jgi:hypothetical protein
MQTGVRGVLQAEFNARRAKNPDYSLRAYARSLKINAATLSTLLRGKRKLSPASASKLLARIGLSNEERRRMIVETLEESGGAPGLLENSGRILTELELGELNSADHFNVHAALDLKSVCGDPARIADHLDLARDRVERVLWDLATHGLAVREAVRIPGRVDRPWRWKVHPNPVSTTSGIPNAALRKIHREYLERAIDAIESVANPERDLSGITVTTTRARVEEAKVMIAAFRKRLLRFLDAGEKSDRIYRMSVQLFPVSKTKKKSGREK